MEQIGMKDNKNYFTIEELTKSVTANKLHIDNVPPAEAKAKLVELITTVLNPIRRKWKSPIFVSSGYRCPKLNKAVGGSSTSQHLKGEAADIYCKDNKELFILISSMVYNGEIKIGQLIDEKNYSWLHISLPTNKHYNHILHLK